MECDCREHILELYKNQQHFAVEFEKLVEHMNEFNARTQEVIDTLYKYIDTNELNHLELQKYINL